MRVRFTVCMLYTVIAILVLATSAQADTLFTENFGSGNDWTTTIPGWAKSSTLTSGRDDHLSSTGFSDGNYYAWISGGLPGDESIQKSSISTLGRDSILLQFSYNILGLNGTQYLITEWKPSTSSTWTILHQVSGVQGWNIVIVPILGAENTTIDIRFRESAFSDNDKAFIDSITITGVSLGVCTNSTLNPPQQSELDNLGPEASCALTHCGDGTIQYPNEQGTGGANNNGLELCDDGNTNNSDSCNNNCAGPFVCGNGIQETGEACDDGNNNAGDGCSRSCRVETAGDPLLCGNDALDLDEDCDGNNLNGETCESQGFANGTLVCNSDCTFNVDSCVLADECGNGLIDPPNEVCDGSNLDDQSCLTLGYDGGDLSCAQCSFDTSDCFKCGDGNLDNGEECDDGNTNAYDACTNSCTDAQCGDGVIHQNIEECDDGNTNNGDGCNSTCFNEQSNFCSIPIDVLLIIDRSGSMVTIPPPRLPDAKTAAITFVNLLNFSSDIAGLVTFNESARLDQSLTSNKTAVINAINAINANGTTNIGDGLLVARQEIVLNGRDNSVIILLSDGAPNVYPGGFCFVNPSSPTNCTIYAQSQANLTKDAGVELFVVGLGVNNFTRDLLTGIATSPAHYFDAANSTVLESIYLQIAQQVCPCGDGNLDAGEECDDGNNINYDSCTNLCISSECGDGIVEIGVEECDDANSIDDDECTNSCTLTYCGDANVQQPNGMGQGGPSNDGFEECDDGNTNYFDNCLNNCVLNECGDGYIEIGVEQCDDGNLVNGDGCDNECMPEIVCGNGVLEIGEQCDDGNTNNGDGCDALCRTEICGNGRVDFGEQCDDANNNTNDQCTNNCTRTFCGDAIVQQPNGNGTGGLLNNGFEQCDDGNINTNDTCLPSCILNVCGDGILNIGVEECDDGNLVNGDGCSAQCDAEFCGDNAVQQGLSEQCELPNTSDNSFCAQSTTTCLGNQTGTRDQFGNCDGSCGCTQDPFTYQCLAGQCGAQCAVDSDCDDDNGFTTDICDTSICGCRNILQPPVEGDAKVSQALPNSNFGLGQYMIVNPKTTARDRSYMRVDARAFLGENITQADLKLHVYYTGISANGTQLEAYYCSNHSFNELTINWNNQPLNASCTLADTLVVGSRVIAGVPETVHTFDLLPETQNELLNGDGFFTVVIKSSLEESGISDNSKFVQYVTKEYAEASYRPEFEVQ